ncbi:MAG: fatty acid desaturase [Rhodothermales bacterium]
MSFPLGRDNCAARPARQNALDLMSQAPASPARSRSLDWTNVLFLGGYHLLLVILLPIYLIQADVSASLVWSTAGLWTLCLLAITMGYHRLYAHVTYKTHPMIEAFLAFWGTVATQGSIFSWSHDHRIHHRHVDTDLDPYSAPKGFWHSHVLWMLRKRPEINPRIIQDLWKRPTLQFQHKHFGSLMVVANTLAWAAVWAITGDPFGAFVIGVLLRMFLVHHCTWFINSLAHMWGSQPYSTEHTAVNNFILSILTFGEGYHNYHHTFAGDYRNGVRWWQFDPAKIVIWTLSKIGLARDLKKVNQLTIKRRLVAADRHLMMERLEELKHRIDVDSWSQRVEDAAASLTENLIGLKTASDKLQRLKKETFDNVRTAKAAKVGEMRAVRDETIQQMRSVRDEKMAEMRTARDETIQQVRDAGQETLQQMRQRRDEELDLLQQRIDELKATVSDEMDAWKEMVHLLLETPESRLAMIPVTA